jgi:hypothetical protein
MLYILLSFYLLPSLATILKVRKRKLALSDASFESASIIGSSNFLGDTTNSLVSDISLKIASIDSAKSQNNTISSTLNVLSLKIETLRHFNFSVLNQTQFTTLFIS